METIFCDDVQKGQDFDTHRYSSKTCQKCGHVFCYSCCKGTNVDQGGKYDLDYMHCPNCGHDYYSE